MKRPSKPIPKFSAESEEREFWESPSNDSTAYVDWSQAISVKLNSLQRDLRNRVQQADNGETPDSAEYFEQESG